MNQDLIHLLPGAEAAEMNYVQQVISTLTPQQQQAFKIAYLGARIKPDTVLWTCLVGGLLGVAGIHRFIGGQIGMGILYLLTGGLCLIGTIVDAFNYRKLTTEFNIKKAREIRAQMGFIQ